MTIRRSSTRLLRSSKLRRWTVRSCGARSNSWSSSVLDGVVQALHRLEVTVHDVVQQAVQQVADAELGQIRAGVPAVHDGADVQPVILADGDQRPPGDEGGELAGGQFTRAGVQPRAVGGQEQVAAVAVELGALVLMHGVLDRQRVQPEFLAQHRQVLAVGVTQVEPDGDRLIGQVITDLGHRETLELEYSVPVEPRAGLALGRGGPADGGRGHRVGIAAVKGLVHRRPAAQHAAGRAARIAVEARGARRAGLRLGHCVLLASLRAAGAGRARPGRSAVAGCPGRARLLIPCTLLPLG